MEVAARLAAADDAGELSRLEGLARAAIVDARGGPQRLAELPIVDSAWAELVTTGDTIVAVGTFGDVVVGYCLVEIDEARCVGRVEHLFVEEQARELGLGEALIDIVVETLRGRQTQAIEAVALPGDRETKNLFERFGIKARSITVYKCLQPEE